MGGTDCIQNVFENVRATLITTMHADIDCSSQGHRTHQRQGRHVHHTHLDLVTASPEEAVPVSCHVLDPQSHRCQLLLEVIFAPLPQLLSFLPFLPFTRSCQNQTLREGSIEHHQISPGETIMATGLLCQVRMNRLAGSDLAASGCGPNNNSHCTIRKVQAVEGVSHAMHNDTIRMDLSGYK